MAINDIGAMLGLGLPTAAPGLGQSASAASKPQDAAAAAKAQADATAARQKADLDAVREKGIYAWAQEQKFEKLREKIEAEIKAAKGVDDTSLAALSPEDRAATQSTLEAEIAQRLQQAMQESLTGEAQKAAKEGRPAGPMIIDISV